MKTTKIFILSLVALVCFTSFKILDSKSINLFLAKFEKSLDLHGIDIMLDWTSNVKTEGRPVLAPLANYEVSFVPKENEWIKSFKNLDLNALIAMEDNFAIYNTENFSEFLTEWNNTSKEEKVFLSFAREDIVYAEAIRSSLENNGYIVFTYIQKNGTVIERPEIIATCMKEAGNVLVLDTEVSRKKGGVITEALAYAKYTCNHLPEQTVIAENKNLESQLIESIKSMSAKESTPGLAQKSFQEQLEILERDEYHNDLRIPPTDKISVTPESINNKNTNSYIQELLQKSYKEKSAFEYNSYLKTFSTRFSETSVNGLSALKSILPFFIICPYYRIPMAICPICSRNFR